VGKVKSDFALPSGAHKPLFFFCFALAGEVQGIKQAWSQEGDVLSQHENHCASVLMASFQPRMDWSILGKECTQAFENALKIKFSAFDQVLNNIVLPQSVQTHLQRIKKRLLDAMAKRETKRKEEMDEERKREEERKRAEEERKRAEEERKREEERSAEEEAKRKEAEAKALREAEEARNDTEMGDAEAAAAAALPHGGAGGADEHAQQLEDEDNSGGDQFDGGGDEFDVEDSASSQERDYSVEMDQSQAEQLDIDDSADSTLDRMKKRFLWLVGDASSDLVMARKGRLTDQLKIAAAELGREESKADIIFVDAPKQRASSSAGFEQAMSDGLLTKMVDDAVEYHLAEGGVLAAICNATQFATLTAHCRISAASMTVEPVPLVITLSKVHRNKGNQNMTSLNEDTSVAACAQQRSSTASG
jgi:hypothetical protein